MQAGERTMWAAILKAPWQQRRNDGGLWGQILVLAMLALPAVLLLVLGSESQRRNGLAVWATVCLQIAWLHQFGSVLRQNHPLAARLVPGHVRSLRQVALSTWLLFSTATAVLLGATQGEPLAWGVAAALGMLATAVLLRWPWLWLAVWLLPLLANLLDQAGLWSSPWRTAWALWQRQPLAWGLGLLLAAGWCLSRLLQEGGGSHARAHATFEKRRRALRDSLRGNRLALREQGQLGIWLVQRLETPFRWWTRHLLRSARLEPRSVLARAEVCLGAGSHWVTQLTSAVLVLLFAALPSYVGSRYFGWDLRYALEGGGLTGISIGLLSLAVNPLLALRTAAHSSRREQALLMLLPGMPRGVQLNRMLAQRHLRQYLCAWLGTSLALLGLCAALDMAPHFLGYAMAGLPFSVLLLRDWSGLREPSPNQVVGTVVAMMSLGAVFAALLLWTSLGPWTLLALVALPTGVALRLRWQALLRWPQAWPTARLAR